MIIEIDELDFQRYSPEQLRIVRPDIVRLAEITRRNLRLLDSALGIEAKPPDTARQHESLRSNLHEANVLADALRDDLDHARARIAVLEKRLADIEDDEQTAVYRSVGLAVTAHQVVINAARRALLCHLHPDRAPPDGQAAATLTFQRASAAFDQIGVLRGC